jgi:hypothetical protein
MHIIKALSSAGQFMTYEMAQTFTAFCGKVKTKQEKKVAKKNRATQASKYEVRNVFAGPLIQKDEDTFGKDLCSFAYFSASGLRKEIIIANPQAHGKRGRKPNKQQRWAKRTGGECNIRPLSRKLALETELSRDFRDTIHYSTMRDMERYVDE